MEPLCVDGKFFRAGGSRVTVRAVTYGPFPGGWPEDFAADFQRIAAAGFNALRLYEMPHRRLLDAALAAGLRVFAGLKWPHAVDFLKDERILAAARVSLAEGLRPFEGHPALSGIFVANEVPSDLVRWMGPVRVRRALEELIALGKELRPDVLWCYGNYPSTEYLEPENADSLAAALMGLVNDEPRRRRLGSLGRRRIVEVLNWKRNAQVIVDQAQRLCRRT